MTDNSPPIWDYYKKPCEHMTYYIDRMPIDRNIILESEDPHCSLTIGCKNCNFTIYLDDARAGGRKK